MADGLSGFLDDPLTQLSLGLLGGQSPHFGQNLMQALMYQKQMQEQADKRKQNQGALEMQQMQLAQAKQAQQDQEMKRRLAQQFIRPGPQNLTPNDDQGFPMPPVGAPPQVDLHGYMGAMAGAGLIDPMQLAGLDAKERVKVDPGQTIGTYRNGQFVPDYSAPDKPPTGMMRDASGKLVYDPQYIAGQKDIRAASRPQVNVEMKQESEFGKKMGGHFADNYNDILRSGASANGRMADLNRFQSIIGKIPTGKAEPLKAEISKLASSLGVKVDTEKLNFQEALDSLSNQYALQLRNPSGGAGMPGAMSDKDREFLVSMVPGLGKTPGGNQMIVEAFKRVAQRDAEVAKLARLYREKTGRFDEGFYAVLAQELGSKDMLGDLYEKVSTLSKQPGNAVYRFDRQGNPVQ